MFKHLCGGLLSEMLATVQIPSQLPMVFILLVSVHYQELSFFPPWSCPCKYSNISSFNCVRTHWPLPKYVNMVIVEILSLSTKHFFSVSNVYSRQGLQLNWKIYQVFREMSSNPGPCLLGELLGLQQSRFLEVLTDIFPTQTQKQNGGDKAKNCWQNQSY